MALTVLQLEQFYSIYRKVFDFIDHGMVLHKLCKLDLPRGTINWIIDFLSNRSQRIKSAHGYFSDSDPGYLS